MNITITGDLGSGKTSVCKEFKKMGMEIISGGDIFRSVAKEKNISVTEMNELAKTDPTYDNMVDERTARLGRELDNIVFDSRLAWHFAPQSFKVFLLIDPDEAARRVFEGDNRQAETYSSKEDTKQGLFHRANLEQERFMKLYSIDYHDGNNYDLIIESSYASPASIAEEIIKYYKAYTAKPWDKTVILLNSASFAEEDLQNNAVAPEENKDFVLINESILSASVDKLNIKNKEYQIDLTKIIR